MKPYVMAFKADSTRVRLVLSSEHQEMLRACLPPPGRFWSGKPAPALLESLAIWLDAPLRVVLDAVEPVDGFSLELTDELGIGNRTVFYEVVPVERHAPVRRRLRGVGDMRDVHQLYLLDRLSGGGR
jgi:hypothetical protein